MKSPGIVIVGGGPAALSVARSYRESGGTEGVTMIAREPHPPYDRPPLTKEFLRGEMPPTDLPLVSPDWYEDSEVDLMLATEATALDPSAHELTLSDGTKLPYGRCVLATGSSPLLPPVPGMDEPGICVVRTLEDSERLVSAAHRVKDYGDGRFIVVGSGFIGCEAAASLAILGLEVSIVTLEEAPQSERLGDDAARHITTWLHDLGVTLYTGAEVRSVSRQPSEEADGSNGSPGFRVEFGDRGFFEGCGIVVGAGTQPDTALAERAGLRVDGGISCDSSMRTSDPDVFAAGDVALALNDAAGRPLRVEHWGDALGQGRVCGEVLAGRETTWREVPGFWSTIGHQTLKYAAWGDGWDEARFTGDPDSLTVWYGLGNRCVGVLSHNNDEDYESGREIIGRGSGIPL